MVLFAFIATSGFSQKETRRELKAERKIEKQKLVEAMVTAREFVFNAHRAMPQGYRSMDLTTNPGSVEFHPDMIKSYLPYFGRATSAVAYSGSDGGIKFEGKPDEYTVTAKKKGYQVSAVVKGSNDVYRLSLFVGSEGIATLTIISDNRSTISYDGEIDAPEKPEE